MTEFDQPIEFPVRFEEAKGYKNFGLTGATTGTKFMLPDGTVLTQKASYTEAEARDFYQRVIYSKKDGYDLENLPAPLSAMAADIAINQYDVGGTLLITANKLKAPLLDLDGKPMTFNKADRDGNWFDSKVGTTTKVGQGKIVKAGNISYQDTDEFKLYEANKQLIIETYKLNPQKFLQELTNTRLEMYSCTRGRATLTDPKNAASQTHFAEWSERAFANYGYATALLANPAYSVTDVKTNFAANATYKKLGNDFAAALGNAKDYKDSIKDWYGPLDTKAQAVYATIDAAKGTVPVANPSPAPANDDQAKAKADGEKAGKELENSATNAGNKVVEETTGIWDKIKNFFGFGSSTTTPTTTPSTPTDLAHPGVTPPVAPSEGLNAGGLIGSVAGGLGAYFLGNLFGGGLVGKIAGFLMAAAGAVMGWNLGDKYINKWMGRPSHNEANNQTVVTNGHPGPNGQYPVSPQHPIETWAPATTISSSEAQAIHNAYTQAKAQADAIALAQVQPDNGTANSAYTNNGINRRTGCPAVGG